jgi:hypothetical protein
VAIALTLVDVAAAHAPLDQTLLSRLANTPLLAASRLFALVAKLTGNTNDDLEAGRAPAVVIPHLANTFLAIGEV